jgi:formylglycine-generating enzyme required for sulfatase activity
VRAREEEGKENFMWRVIAGFAIFTSLLCFTLHLYSQGEVEKLQITAEVKEAAGGLQFAVSGTAEVPDESRVQLWIHFAHENFDGKAVVVTNKKFSHTFGPYKKRYYSGTYTIEALFMVDRQIESVRKQFADQTEILRATRTVRVGTPQKEKEGEREIAALYGKLLANAETLRHDMWTEYKAAIEKKRYFKDKKFDEASWRDFVDTKWRDPLKKDIDKHREYKESFLAIKFPQTATDMEMLFGVLFKLSQNLSAKLYKENKLPEDPKDITPPDWDGVKFEAPVQDETINELIKSIQKLVETILKKTDEDYLRKEPEGMVLVPAGIFHMGTTDEQIDKVFEEARKEFSNEFKEFLHTKQSFKHNFHKPKEVYVKAFYIDKYEVTNADYKKFVDATDYSPPQYWDGTKIPKEMEDHPVVSVTLQDAQNYAKWANKRLPTEEEWEKAARGSKDRRNYPWGDTFSKGKANLWERGEKKPKLKPVGSYSEDKSPCGCYDMCGNVQEWTTDTITITDDKHHQGGQVIRGGSYLDSPFDSRCDFVNWLRPDEKFFNLGFRCVKDAEE